MFQFALFFLVISFLRFTFVCMFCSQAQQGTSMEQQDAALLTGASEEGTAAAAVGGASGEMEESDEEGLDKDE